MNVLVTGGTGFIGRALIGDFLHAGHSVVYTARKRAANMDSRTAFLCWPDYNTEPNLAGAGRFDAVIHLAGEPVAQRWNADVKKRIWDSRVVGTRNLVCALGKLRHKPEVLISGSAIGYYGDCGDEILTESSQAGKGILSDLCAAWEQEASAAASYGMRTVMVRIGLVLGANGGMLGRMVPIFKAGLGGRLASGKQWMSWILREDLIRLIRFATERTNVEGPVNGVAPDPVRNVEFTQALAKALHRPAILPVPRFGLRLAMGEVADHVLESMRVVPEAAEAAGFSFEYRTLEAALSQIVRPTYLTQR